MKYIYSILILCIGLAPAMGQVGINSTDPQAALDVVGDVKMDGSLTLEDPGDNSEIRGSKFLIRSVSNDMLRYDINTSKYGPINYAEFAFRDVSTDGLQDYDTKISTSEYFVSIQGFSLLRASNGRDDVMVHSTVSDDNIEGYQIYAYPDIGTQTWHIKAYANNSQFQAKSGDVYVNLSVDILMNVMIYRRGFITKAQNDVILDMGNLETGTAPLPAGF